jgi:signal transduction histidine kinase
MSDRVGAVGGTLNVDSAVGRGATISGRIPITVPAQSKVAVS